MGHPTNPTAANGLAIVRVTIGVMFIWVFFENLGKGLYTPAGYAGLIGYYLKASHCPAVWKSVMSLAAGHAAIAAPMQGMTEISLGYSARNRSVHPTRGNCSVSVSRQSLDFRVRHLVDMGTAGFGAGIARTRDRTGPAAHGALTRGRRNAGHLLRGGDWAGFTGERSLE